MMVIRSASIAVMSIMLNAMGQFVSSAFLPFLNPDKCQSLQYFHYPSLSCKNCGVNQVKDRNGFGCTCARGFKIIQNNGGPDVRCAVCDVFETNSDDGWSCVKCPTDTTYDSATRTCRKCSSGNIFLDKQQSGAIYSDFRKKCVKCTNGTQPEVDKCRRCHQNVLAITQDGSCVCPIGTKVVQGSSPGQVSTYTIEESGGICFSSLTTTLVSNTASTFTVKYSGQSIESAFFKSNLRAAQALCNTNQNYTACQLLGNLCVMLDYNEDNFVDSRFSGTDACKEFLQIAQRRSNSGPVVSRQFDWPENMPWLYYKFTSDTAKETLEKTSIVSKFKIRQTLKFAISIYTANGTFRGIQTDLSMMQLCNEGLSKMEAAFKFATTYSVKCKLSVIKLWKQRETLFHDLYFFVDDTNMYAVPLLLENYKLNGEAVNSKTTMSSWKLFRRFFIVDNLSGRTQLNSPASVVRYAKSVQLVFRLRSSEGQIYPPYLKINYASVQVGSDRTKETDTVDASFSVSYEMDTTVINKNVEIATGVLSGLALLYAVGRTFSWRRRSGIVILGFAAVIKFAVFTLAALSCAFFAVVAGTCFQWLIFFKQQTTVYRLLPTSNQESLLKALLISAFVFKLIDICHLIYVQVTTDVYFLDWERPKGRITDHNGDPQPLPVSIMRTLFVANEWREVQTVRRIKPYILVLGVLFILKVVGVEYLTTTDPISRTKVDQAMEYVGPFSFVLRFAISSILFLSVGVAQWIFFGFIYERFVSDAIGDFVDFCSLSNVSIFILTHDQFGYYIHGRSVHGYADSNLKELYENFKREENNLCGSRGLEPNSDRQSFEIQLTGRFRENYQRCSEGIKNFLRRAQQRNEQSGARQNTGINTPLPETLEYSINAYNNLNRFLTSFIEHSYPQCDYIVRDKVFFERLLDFEVEEVYDKGMFYNDVSGRAFSSVFLYGAEWSILLFDTLLFTIVDLAATDYTLASILTFLADYILVLIRDTVGKKNLSRKTLIDERFLI